MLEIIGVILGAIFAILIVVLAGCVALGFILSFIKSRG